MGQLYRSADADVEVSVDKRAGEQFAVRAGALSFTGDVRLVDAATLHLEADGVARIVYVVRRGDAVEVFVDGNVYHFVRADEDSAAVAHGVQTPRITAPMPGKVLRILVREGQEVARGDGLIILEAMKMENRIVAEGAARIVRLAVAEGQTVEAGALLLELEQSD